MMLPEGRRLKLRLAQKPRKDQSRSRRKGAASSGQKLSSQYSKVTIIGICVMLVVVGTLLQIPTLGQLVIALYGVVAFTIRIRSDDTFKMALIALLFIPVLFSLGNIEMADTFAIYAFLLLCIGTVSAALEERRRRRKEVQRAKIRL